MRSSTVRSKPVRVLIEQRALRLANYRARGFWIGTSGWIAFFIYPLLPGWCLRGAYKALQTSGLSSSFVLYAVVLLAAELAMATLLLFCHRTYMQAFMAGESLVQANVLNAQLANGGKEQGPRALSSGDAVARFRDDPHDLLMLVDNWVDVGGAVGYAVLALAILASVDLLAAVVAIVPLVAIGIFNKLVGNHIRKLRFKARSASSDATDFLAAAFGASLTVKVSGALDGVISRIDTLNKKRSIAMVADQTWSDALWSVNGAAVDMCIGLSLLVASRRVLNAGDIALFASYAVHLIWLPQKVGGVIVGRRRFEVSAERLDALLPTAPGFTATGLAADSVNGVRHEALDNDSQPTSTRTLDPLTFWRPLPLLGGPAAQGIVRPVRVPLQRLDVHNLSVYDRGLHNVSFSVTHGTLTVVSGMVGSGKTSLLKAIIGLLPIDSGEICWNGNLVVDRSAFFVPPQCAYVAQVPQLFSETLLDNLLLGTDVDPTEAIRLAAFDEDVKSFSLGIHTVVGAGGVRLSGGQAQRAAAARALIHRAELILFDDLTSALDVETERILWDRLAASESTVIAVSNRNVARSRADQIIEIGA
jgi:ATP-binding cassette, subfamily B, bacterial